MNSSSSRFYTLSDDLDRLYSRLTSSTSTDGHERLIAEAETMLTLMHKEITTADVSSRPRMENIYHRRSEAWNRIKRGLKAIDSSNQSLTRATRMAEENQQIGTEVLSELDVQREKLTRTRDVLTETDVELGRTHRILRSMNRRVYTNKCLLLVIIALELTTLAILVYYKFIRSHKWASLSS